VYEPTSFSTAARVYALFTVTLSKAYPTKVTVKVASANGTATSSTDYYRLYTTTVTFKAGETVKTVKVRVHTDDIVEPLETFQVLLTKPNGAPLVDGIGTGTIGADPPPPVVSISDAIPVAEPVTSSPRVYAEFTVTLSKPWGKTVTVRVKSAPGTATRSKDYSSVSTTVTFSAGQTVKTVRVRTYRDSLIEPQEQFTMTLSSPTRATIGTATATGTINAS
jgi:chitinase